MTHTEKQKAPEIISFRVNELRPLVEKWMAQNPGVPVSKIGQCGARIFLKPIAGKRYAHLVDGGAL